MFFYLDALMLMWGALQLVKEILRFVTLQLVYVVITEAFPSFYLFSSSAMSN